MVEVLERGDIRFFYRPVVQAVGDLEGRPGVQSFFVVLGRADGTHRRIRVGRKRLPNPSERLWARVERVGSFARVLGDQLDDERYTTKTRGERIQPAAAAIAEGSYAFVRHDDHVHLVYRVEHPEPDVPDEVRVPDEGSHVVLFERVPRTSATWTTAGDPAHLDEGSELVLVGIEDELGMDVLPA